MILEKWLFQTVRWGNLESIVINGRSAGIFFLITGKRHWEFYVTVWATVILCLDPGSHLSPQNITVYQLNWLIINVITLEFEVTWLPQLLSNYTFVIPDKSSCGHTVESLYVMQEEDCAAAKPTPLNISPFTNDYIVLLQAYKQQWKFCFKIWLPFMYIQLNV